MLSQGKNIKTTPRGWVVCPRCGVKRRDYTMKTKNVYLLCEKCYSVTVLTMYDRLEGEKL